MARVPKLMHKRIYGTILVTKSVFAGLFDVMVEIMNQLNISTYKGEGECKSIIHKPHSKLTQLPWEGQWGGKWGFIPSPLPTPFDFSFFTQLTARSPWQQSPAIFSSPSPAILTSSYPNSLLFASPQLTDVLHDGAARPRQGSTMWITTNYKRRFETQRRCGIV